MTVQKNSQRQFELNLIRNELFECSDAYHGDNIDEITLIYRIDMLIDRISRWIE